MAFSDKVLTLQKKPPDRATALQTHTQVGHKRPVRKKFWAKQCGGYLQQCARDEAANAATWHVAWHALGVVRGSPVLRRGRYWAQAWRHHSFYGAEVDVLPRTSRKAAPAYHIATALQTHTQVRHQRQVRKTCCEPSHGGLSSAVRKSRGRQRCDVADMREVATCGATWHVTWHPLGVAWGSPALRRGRYWAQAWRHHSLGLLPRFLFSFVIPKRPRVKRPFGWGGAEAISFELQRSLLHVCHALLFLLRLPFFQPFLSPLYFARPCLMPKPFFPRHPFRVAVVFPLGFARLLRRPPLNPHAHRFCGLRNGFAASAPRRPNLGLCGAKRAQQLALLVPGALPLSPLLWAPLAAPLFALRIRPP